MRPGGNKQLQSSHSANQVSSDPRDAMGATVRMKSSEAQGTAVF
jgi:hypothetical protein